MRSAPRSLVPRTTGHVRTVALGLFTASALLVGAAPASAALVRVGAPPADPAARVTGIPVPSTELPSPTASAARLRDDPPTGRWLVGVRGDRTAAAALVRHSGGTFDSTLGLASVPVAEAGRLAHRLGSQVRWAGPDVVATRLSSLELPGGVISPWSRSVGDIPSLTPPDGSLATIGFVDDEVSHQVQELSLSSNVNNVGVVDPHGTMVASTAAAPYNGVGVVGVAPRAPVLSWGTDLSCGDVSTGIIALVRRGAKVINLSLGFTDNCFALWDAVSYAYARGVSVVAAAGNEGHKLNRLAYPASYPHVVTAAAVDQNLQPAYFSNYNDYVDLAAPGVAVPVDIPKKYDGKTKADRVVDGVTTVNGTSFAAPYVSGALSWLLGARPGLDPGQAAALLRESAVDLAAPGWDQRTGYGLVQVAAAMAATAPPVDLLEPNDDPSFTRAGNKGVFGKPTVWAGGAPVTLNASGDSADDPVDGYRVKVPAHGVVNVTLQAGAGLTDLYAFDQSVISFGGRPVDHSTNPGLEPDTISLHNSGSRSRIAFVVVNSVDDGVMRTLSQYALTIGPG